MIQQPDTLLTISARSLVSLVDAHTDILATLPLGLKDLVRNLLLKNRGAAISARVLDALLHEKVSEIDLSLCPTVSGQLLECLVKCSNLTRLCLDHTGAVIKPGWGTSMRHLHTIHLRRCIIDDVGLAKLAQGCPCLAVVDLGDCSDVGDEGVASLGAACQELQSVGLSSTSVGDVGLLAFAAAQSPGDLLEELRIDGCSRVSDDGISAVLDFCLSLKIFLFHNCPLVTDRTREMLDAYTANGVVMKQLTWTIY